MSYSTYSNSAAPATPASGKTANYVDTTGRPHSINSSGVDNVLAGTQLSNSVRNSGFWFAQRQAPATLTTYSSTAGRAICADGWGICNENASAQYRRVDTQAAPEANLNGRFWGEFTKITATGKLHVFQAIENQDMARLRGRTVRLQCKMKQVVGAAPVIRLGLIQLQAAGTLDTIPATFISAHGANAVDPTLGTNLARITPKAGVAGDNCTVNGNAADCTLSSAWQRFGAVFDVPTDAKNLVVALWSNAQLVATNGFGIAEVTLTDGFEIQDFSSLPFTTEFVRVQRFYQKTFAVDTLPAQNTGVATGCLRTPLLRAAATALAVQMQWLYPVRLRAAATTITLFNPGAANAQVRQIGGVAADTTATATANSSELGFDITATGAAGGVVGDQCGVHATADAEL